MKKMIIVITLLALAISLCACSNDRVPTANALEEAPKSKEPVEIVLYEGDFTVIKTDWSKYDTESVCERYMAVLEHDDKRVMIEIGAEQYACWDENDIVTGTLTLTPANGWNMDQLRLVVGEKKFFVRWSQMYNEAK